MARQLHGKVAIVVGASSGMGRATAARFAAEGARVVVAARNEAPLAGLVDAIQAADGEAIAVPTDVTDRAQVQRLLTTALDRFGRIDLLVYATGTNIPDRSLDRLTPATWELLLATNVTGAYHCTQLVVPVMREQGGGLILYLSTGAVKRADASGIAYQASKCAMSGLAGGTMEEEKRNGIRTSVIFPGLTDTPLVLRRPVPTPPEVMAHALQPDDVAAACLFVATLPERCHVPELVLLPSRL